MDRALIEDGEVWCWWLNIYPIKSCLRTPKLLFSHIISLINTFMLSCFQKGMIHIHPKALHLINNPVGVSKLNFINLIIHFSIKECFANKILIFWFLIFNFLVAWTVKKKLLIFIDYFLIVNYCFFEVIYFSLSD